MRVRSTILLATLLTTVACGHDAPPETTAPSFSPAAGSPPPVTEAEELAAEDLAKDPGTGTVDFSEDEVAEPTDTVQTAPKRKPIPSFRLMGTRASDGPG